MSGLPPTAANLSKRVQLFAIAPPRAAFWISTSSMEASLLGEMSSISIRTYRGYKRDCVGIRRVARKCGRLRKHGGKRNEREARGAQDDAGMVCVVGHGNSPFPLYYFNNFSPPISAAQSNALDQ